MKVEGSSRGAGEEESFEPHEPPKALKPGRRGEKEKFLPPPRGKEV